MRKIPTLFKRDPEDMRRVTDEVTPGCEWVLAGEGMATRKYDGTCVMLDSHGEWWARREVKAGKPNPPNFQPVETDGMTMKTVGWEPIGQSSFAKFHTEALGAGGYARSFTAGTYELCGPKINGNPEGLADHQMIPHGLEILGPEFATLRTFEEWRSVVTIHATIHGWEGIVWHHPDGRMAKLKARDFA